MASAAGFDTCTFSFMGLRLLPPRARLLLRPARPNANKTPGQRARSHLEINPITFPARCAVCADACAVTFDGLKLVAKGSFNDANVRKIVDGEISRHRLGGIGQHRASRGASFGPLNESIGQSSLGSPFRRRGAFKREPSHVGGISQPLLKCPRAEGRAPRPRAGVEVGCGLVFADGGTEVAAFSFFSPDVLFRELCQERDSRFRGRARRGSRGFL